jgi:hypothetical protein
VAAPEQGAAPLHLFQQLSEILFRNAKLFEDLEKEPSADFAVAVNRNSSRPAIWMFPPGMASFLPGLFKSQLFRRAF